MSEGAGVRHDVIGAADPGLLGHGFWDMSFCACKCEGKFTNAQVLACIMLKKMEGISESACNIMYQRAFMEESWGLRVWVGRNACSSSHTLDPKPQYASSVRNRTKKNGTDKMDS